MMHRILFLVFLVALCVYGTAHTTFAISDNFTVRQLVGVDTTPPTIPTGLTAIPVATSQIDLAWGTSTDDFLLAGYQVFRDDVQIATTTATIYSDVGLIASTTYSYYVTAFDAVNNISASSTIVSTTTLSSTTPPSPQPNATSTTGSIVRLKLTRLEVIPEQYAVTIRYETNGYARTIIRWGRSISYELGSLAERLFRTYHETKIVGLSPGTVYKFSIEGENSIGRQSVLTESTFTTLPAEDTFPPGNVRNLRAVKDGNDIVLSWVNPNDTDLSRVRVLRSDQFYPSDIADGWVVYEGLDESVRDVGMVKDGTRQFYTVFTYDALGNISSGAVVSISFKGDTSTPVVVVDETLNPLSLTLSDFDFIQEGERRTLIHNQVVVDGSKALTISLPYSRVPEHLKTILVTFNDSLGENTEFSFLLRINADKTGYDALLAPLGVSGTFPIRISVFDFKTTQIGYVQGDVVSRIEYIPNEVSQSSYFLSLIQFVLRIFTSYFFWFIFLLLVATYGGWRLVKSPT